MTQEEYDTLQSILNGKPFMVRPELQSFMLRAKVHVSPENAPTGLVAPQKGIRTDNQNRAMHLWFRQIAETCQNQGVTMNMVINHVHDVSVTEHGVKSLWHVLQKALFGTQSTTEIKKSGQIDKLVDHFVALFAKEEVELPPFPNDPTKNNIKLEQMNNLSNKNYPEYSPPLL
jgi:hypothetical protein